MKTNETNRNQIETDYQKFRTWYNISRFPKQFKDLNLYDLKNFIQYCSFRQRKTDSEIFNEMKDLELLDEELEAADNAALEELVPMEKEAIQERFSEFLDWPEIAIFKGWTDEDRIVAFMNELNYGFYRQKWSKPNFHSDNEVREICRKWLTERSAQWRLGGERGFYYQPVLK